MQYINRYHYLTKKYIYIYIENLKKYNKRNKEDILKRQKKKADYQYEL